MEMANDEIVAVVLFNESPRMSCYRELVDEAAGAFSIDIDDLLMDIINGIFYDPSDLEVDGPFVSRMMVLVSESSVEMPDDVCWRQPFGEFTLPIFLSFVRRQLIDEMASLIESIENIKLAGDLWVNGFEIDYVRTRPNEIRLTIKGSRRRDYAP